jgi:hypothetical protein
MNFQNFVLKTHRAVLASFFEESREFLEESREFFEESREFFEVSCTVPQKTGHRSWSKELKIC